MTLSSRSMAGPRLNMEPKGCRRIWTRMKRAWEGIRKGPVTRAWVVVVVRGMTLVWIVGKRPQPRNPGNKRKFLFLSENASVGEEVITPGALVATWKPTSSPLILRFAWSNQTTASNLQEPSSLLSGHLEILVPLLGPRMSSSKKSKGTKSGSPS